MTKFYQIQRYCDLAILVGKQKRVREPAKMVLPVLAGQTVVILRWKRGIRDNPDVQGSRKK